MNWIEKLQEMLKTSPSDDFLRHALALEYIKQGNDDEARDLFLAILHQSPGYVGSYYHLAKLYERNNQNAEAVYWYEKGMEAAKEGKDNHAFNELQSAYEDLIY